MQQLWPIPCLESEVASRGCCAADPADLSLTGLSRENQSIHRTAAVGHPMGGGARLGEAGTATEAERFFSVAMSSSL